MLLFLFFRRRETMGESSLKESLGVLEHEYKRYGSIDILAVEEIAADLNCKKETIVNWVKRKDRPEEEN